MKTTIRAYRICSLADDLVRKDEGQEGTLAQEAGMVNEDVLYDKFAEKYGGSRHDARKLCHYADKSKYLKWSECPTGGYGVYLLPKGTDLVEKLWGVPLGVIEELFGKKYTVIKAVVLAVILFFVSKGLEEALSRLS